MSKLSIQQEEFIVSILSEAVSRSISLAEILTETGKANNSPSIIALNEINNYYLTAKSGYYLKVDQPEMVYIDLFNVFEKLYLELRHALAYDGGKINFPEDFSELLRDARHYFEIVNGAFVDKKNASI